MRFCNLGGSCGFDCVDGEVEDYKFSYVVMDLPLYISSVLDSCFQYFELHIESQTEAH